MRRSRFEQMMDILASAVQPILKTNLCDKARIPFHESGLLFKFLEEKGHLDKIEIPRRGYRKRKKKFMYLTTRKGLEVLELLKSPPLKELLDYPEWLQRQKEISSHAR